MCIHGQLEVMMSEGLISGLQALLLTRRFVTPQILTFISVVMLEFRYIHMALYYAGKCFDTNQNKRAR